MEPSNPFKTLDKLLGVQDITNEKILNVDLFLESINVTSKLEFLNLSSENYDPNPKFTFTQTIDPHFCKHCENCHKSKHSVPNCFRKQQEMKK